MTAKHFNNTTERQVLTLGTSFAIYWVIELVKINKHIYAMSLVKRNRLFFPTMEDFFGPDWFGGTSNAMNTLPAVNIKENEKSFELELAIPGQKRDDFNIEVDEHVLTISMEVRAEDEEVTDRYTRKEFSFSSFTRSFTLPETIDESKIDASYREGILTVLLPKKEEALPKPKRLINIGK